MTRWLDAVGRDSWIASGILFGVCLLVTFPTYDQWVGAMDLGEYVNNPIRLLSGELPYRDFWLVYPPGEVMFPAALYRIFGVNVNCVLLASLLVSASIAAVSFLLMQNLTRRTWIAMVVAILVFTNGVPGRYVGQNYLHFHVFMLVSAALAFGWYVRSRRVAALAICGFCLGVAFWFRIYEVGGAAVAIIVGILTAGRSLRERIIGTAAVGATTGVVVLVAAVPLVAILPVMARAVLVDSVSHGTALPVPYFDDLRWQAEGFMNHLTTARWLSFSPGWFYLLGTKIGWLVTTAFHYVFPAVLLTLAAAYLLDRPRREDKLMTTFFLVWGVLNLPKAFWGVGDVAHLASATTPMFFVLGLVSDWALADPVESRRRVAIVRIWVALSLALLFIPAVLLLVHAAHAGIKRWPVVSAPFGGFRYEDPNTREAARQLIEAIDRYTQRGDHIFVVPEHAPPLYVLTGRRNPTYYDSVIDLVARPSFEKQRATCSAILRGSTKFVVFYGDERGDINRERFLRTNPVLTRCIKDNFEIVHPVGLFQVLRRPPTPRSAAGSVQ